MENVPVKVERLTRYYGKRRGVVDLTSLIVVGVASTVVAFTIFKRRDAIA